MSGLRAPDPTLTALGAEDVTLTYRGEAPPIAHRLTDALAVVAPACEDGMDELRIEADWSAWFAVPCRECFPDAPEPGCHTRERFDGIPERPDGLAWQVALETAPR